MTRTLTLPSLISTGLFSLFFKCCLPLLFSQTTVRFGGLFPLPNGCGCHCFFDAFIQASQRLCCFTNLVHCPGTYSIPSLSTSTFFRPQNTKWPRPYERPLCFPWRWGQARDETIARLIHPSNPRSFFSGE